MNKGQLKTLLAAAAMVASGCDEDEAILWAGRMVSEIDLNEATLMLDAVALRERMIEAEADANREDA